MINYKSFFGFTREPFDNAIEAKDLLKLPTMLAIKDRLDYVAGIGGIMAVTGDVGSGKSTSVRWAISHYHPSQYKILNLLGTNGPAIDFYRQLCWAVELEISSISRATLIKSFRKTISEIVKNKKQKILLFIDEAGLMRPEIFAELHVLTQFENDSKNIFSIIFVGQVNLYDKLLARTSAPLASRVVSRVHLTGISKDQMEEYLNHHTKIAGNKNQLFADQAITAIQQGSSGLLRKANFLARGALIAAANDKKDVASAEHVRMAATELLS